MNRFLETIKNQDYYENFITRSVKNSNAIEGNTLSYAETYSILFVDESLPLQNVNPRELYEAINLKYALTHSLKNNGKLGNGIIIKINELINKNIKDTTGFRKGKVFIKGADFVPPEPFLVPSKMSELLYNYENSDLPLIENIANFHINFEHKLISSGEIPIVIPEERRIEYFEYLANYDIDGLANMIRELQQVEISKMKEYGV